MKKKRVLIADDEKQIRITLKKILKEAGHMCLEAIDGEAAMALIREEDVDIALLDVAMPKMNGIEVMKAIHKESPDVGVLIITGQPDFGPLAETIMENRVYDYILKPFTASAVKKAVQQAIDRQEMQRLPSGTRKTLEKRIAQLETDFLEQTFEFRESQLKYKNMVEHSRDMILVARDGYLLYANPRTTTLSGYSEEELLKIPIMEMIHPDDRQRVQIIREKWNHSKEVPGPIRFRILKKDQTWIWVEMGSMETRWEGKPAALAVLRDISERVRWEEDLKIKDLAIAASPNAVFFADLDGKINQVNRSFLAMFGYDAEAELRGRTIQELILPPVNGPNGPGGQTLLTLEGGFHEMQGRCKDGSTRDLHGSIIRVKDDSRRPLCVMGSFADITDQKRMAELIHRTEKLNSLGQLAAGLAHELKNPLAVISSCAQFCLENMQMDRLLRENLQVVYRNSQRANKLIVELLSFARPARLARKELDVNALLLRTLELTHLETKSSKITFKSTLHPDLPKISGDEDKLRQVFHNIFMNAAQAVGRNGVVAVQTVFDAGYARVDIADNGPGVPIEYRPLIFDPFFTTKDNGTGLGLSICHSIVKEHGGEIFVSCPDTGGTCFSIHLPFRQPSSEGRTGVP